MKIKLFTIPNILTLSNLVCGAIALIEILLYQNFSAAFILIIAAATFDFLDGMMARLLGQYSEIGRELDSLSDMVSFGVVPSILMFSLFNGAEKSLCSPMWCEYGAYITLSILCCSALRLARFNVDSEQKSVFIGLPTPANALFCLSLGLLVESGKLIISAEWIALISLCMALLLIAPLRLFALKFENFAWANNKIRYTFALIAATTLLLLREFSIPIIIVIYILMSVIGNILNRREKIDE
ncbi:MAG: CDP-diacylglycerol--serine O-phosphatidyltransferase [Rikenellaceae bacterium]